MKLWTKALEEKAKRFPFGIQEHEGKELLDYEVIVKYFNPYGRGTWIGLEAEIQPDGDVLFFGLCEIFEQEYGYFSLNEILETKVNVFGGSLPLERDLYIGEHARLRDLI